MPCRTSWIILIHLKFFCPTSSQSRLRYDQSMNWWADLLLTLWHSKMWNMSHEPFCDIWETVSGNPAIPTHIVWGNRWSRNKMPTNFYTIKAVIWPRHGLMGGLAPHSVTFKDEKYASWAFLRRLRNDVEATPILCHLVVFKRVAFRAISCNKDIH